MSEFKIKPLGTNKAFRNPLKGFRGRPDDYKCGKYSTLSNFSFKWNELETCADDGVERIVRMTDEKLAGFRENNVKAVARVGVSWPNHGDHTKAYKIYHYFPDDMIQSTADSPEFFARIQSFVAKLGKAWNSDPRIAYIQTGIYGLWGEQHEDTMSRPAQKNLGDAFTKAFPDKKCTIRKPRDCMGYDFGVYWDSFGHLDEYFYGEQMHDLINWKKAVIGGEVAYNWGNYLVQPGDSPDHTFLNEEHFVPMMDWLHYTRCNYVGWISQYDAENPAVVAKADEMQKILGYRFVLGEVSASAADGRLDVGFSVKNIGSSPMYYNWPVCVHLLDDKNESVWHGAFKTDIREWLPAGDWDREKHAYRDEIPVNQVAGSFDVRDLPKGKYTLALAIHDPANDRPNLRFASDSYFTGGYTAVGVIGLGVDVDDAHIDPQKFADLKTDFSLRY